MLGILANFGKDDPYRAIKTIVDQVQSFTKDEFAGSRYFKQLRIFVQLRSAIEPQFEKAMETITKFFKEENDFLYRKGEEKGIEKGIKETALKMKKSGLDLILIASITGLSIKVIEKL